MKVEIKISKDTLPPEGLYVATIRDFSTSDEKHTLYLEVTWGGQTIVTRKDYDLQVREGDVLHRDMQKIGQQDIPIQDLGKFEPNECKGTQLPVLLSHRRGAGGKPSVNVAFIFSATEIREVHKSLQVVVDAPDTVLTRT